MSNFSDDQSGMAETIRLYLRQNYGLVVSDEEASDIIERLSLETDPEVVIKVSGRDIVTGLRTMVEISRGDLWPPDALILAPRQ